MKAGIGASGGGGGPGSGSSMRRTARGDVPSHLDNLLFRREVGNVRRINPLSDFYLKTKKMTDDPFKIMGDSVHALKMALLKPGNWTDVEYAVGGILTRILDSTNPDQMFVVTPQRRLEREYFIEIGGVAALLQLFEKPWSDPDARMTNTHHLQRKSELWNEVLVIVREIAFAVPTASLHYLGTNHIVYLFTLLSHSCVFENSINLLEEVLSSRIETFDLSLVPDLYSLLSKFSCRQMAHFCRVLSLTVFESEDRLIMEGSHVLRSLELIQLRRDRMAKTNCIVERNQCLVRNVVSVAN
jgi:hypothetical protein